MTKKQLTNDGNYNEGPIGFGKKPQGTLVLNVPETSEEGKEKKRSIWPRILMYSSFLVIILVGVAAGKFLLQDLFFEPNEVQNNEIKKQESSTVPEYDGSYDSPVGFSDDNEEDCLEKGNIYHKDGRCEIFNGSTGGEPDYAPEEKTDREKCQERGGIYNTATYGCMDAKKSGNKEVVETKKEEVKEEVVTPKEVEHNIDLTGNAKKYLKKDKNDLFSKLPSDSIFVGIYKKTKNGQPDFYDLIIEVAGEDPDVRDRVIACTAKINGHRLCDCEFEDYKECSCVPWGFDGEEAGITHWHRGVFYGICVDESDF
jgi:hypothetical protein